MIKTELSDFPILRTPRLQMRALAISDAHALFFMRTNPEVNAYLKRQTPEDIAAVTSFILARNQDFDKRQGIYWAIETKETGTYAGSICLWHFSEDGITAEVGYDLHPDFQGKGIMSEALRTVIDYGFNTLDLQQIEAFTHRENKTSITLLKRHLFVVQSERKDPWLETNLIFTLRRS